MLSEYLTAALRRAEYEQLPDGSWWGRVPGFRGLWADGATQDDCRDELASALEDWVLFALQRNGNVPIVDGMDLAVTETA